MLRAQWVRDEDGIKMLAANEVDLSFLGEDKLRELQLNGQLSDIREIDRIPMDCKMVLAGIALNAIDLRKRLDRGEPLSVVTSYPELARDFAGQRGFNLKVDRVVGGGCEGFVAAKRNDLVFDICSSGKTLVANQLEILEDSDRLSLVVANYCQYLSPLEAMTRKVMNEMFEVCKEQQ